MLKNLSTFPSPLQTALKDIITEAQKAFGSTLKSVILFGSAAEGKLRLTSDVNVLFVIDQFQKSAVDNLREHFRIAHAAVNMRCMFLLTSELNDAASAFTMKFQDIVQRHQVLFGEDIISSLSIPKHLLVHQLDQTLLNLRMRLRERYTMVSLRPEQLSKVIAEATSPLRVAAATILMLEGVKGIDPKSALETVVKELKPQLIQQLPHLSQAREHARLSPDIAESVLFTLIELTSLLQTRLTRIPTGVA